jgi:hypothetical protein
MLSINNDNGDGRNVFPQSTFRIKNARLYTIKTIKTDTWNPKLLYQYKLNRKLRKGKGGREEKSQSLLVSTNQ